MLEFLPVEIVKYILNIYLDYENVVPILSKIINFTFDVTPHVTEDVVKTTDTEYSINKYLDGIIKFQKSYDNEGVTICNYKNGKKDGEYVKYSDYEKKEISFLCNYVDDLIEGIVYEYNIFDYESNLYIVNTETRYMHGQKNGKCVVYINNTIMIILYLE